MSVVGAGMVVVLGLVPTCGTVDVDGAAVGGAVGAVFPGDGVVLGGVGVGFGVGGGGLGLTFPVVQHMMFAAPGHRFRSDLLSTQE